MTRLKYLERYQNFEKRLNELALCYVISYLRTAGLQTHGKHYTKAEVNTLLRVKEKYLKFLDYMLYALEKEKLIRIENEVIIFTENSLNETEIFKLSAALQQDFPEYAELTKLLSHCAKNYSGVLSGEISGVSVVYPSADTDFLKPIVLLVEEIYKIDYQYRVLNKILSNLSKNKSLSIIEVGGGVGQITWKILPRLNSKNIRYHFTDISRFFVISAREQVKKQSLDFVSFGQFDISKDPQMQGLELGSFDFILALNVIHATPNLHDTLDNLKKLLKPGGKIFIIEHVTLPIWANMAWGVLEGWWCFNDAARELLPTLEQSGWEKVLKESGFSDIRAFPKKNKYVNTPLSYLGLLATLGV